MYRKLLLAVLAAGALLWSAPETHAQSLLNLPRPSQHALVSQRLGITDINIIYSRPLVNSRKIWGGLVPYGQVWRAGANENTTIEFTDPVTIEGQPLAKGVYGLHMIPNENEWTVIFSKNSSSWGSFSYDKSEDALRVNVKPHSADLHSALTYDFEDVKPDSTVVELEWEKLAVPFTVAVNNNDVVSQSIKQQLRGGVQYTWAGWDEAANYLLTSKGNLQDALKDSDTSLQYEERFDNLLTKSQVLEALGKQEEATATRNKAIESANVLQLHGYGRLLQTQGKQQEAMDIFRANLKKHPDHWIAHNEAARLACAQGDYGNAVKEMKISAAGAPDNFKPQIDSLVKRLEAKEDINR